MVQWGVDMARFAPGPAPAGLRGRLGLEGRRVVFSPRNITPLYRQQVVLDALAQLPADVAVVMSRHHGQADEIEAVERKVAALRLADRVVIVPEIAHDDMPDFYRLADVVVSIPASDSTSVTILEAMACEKQIVAGDLPSVREWLAELDPGSLVPIDDVAATTAALVRALGLGREERAETGRRARDIVAARADHAASMARVESLYRKLANAASRSDRGRA
jgi:glycosyltransferase involved in cell wall biosynthesis